MKLLKEQLKQVRHLEARVNPDKAWVLRNREKMMTQISHTSKQSVATTSIAPSVGHTMSTWTKIFVPHSLARSFKPVLSVAVALLVTTAGWIASAYAEPGDVLWGAKNAFNSVVETGRLALASDNEQASLKLSYASKQAHILKQVIETDSVSPEVKARLVDETVTSFQKKFDSAEESIKTLAAVDGANLVKEVSLSTLDISQTLKEAVEVAGTENADITEKLEKTASDATKQSLDIVGETLAKKTEANLEFSAEEKAVVKDRIDHAVESIVAEAQKAQDKLDGQSTSTVSASTSTNAVSTSTLLMTVTTNPTTSTDSNQAVAVVKTIGEQKLTVNSLKETNLLEAINTTKILAEQVTTITEKLNAQTNTVIVAPVTPVAPIVGTSTTKVTTSSIETPTKTTSTIVTTTTLPTTSSTPHSP